QIRWSNEEERANPAKYHKDLKSSLDQLFRLINTGMTSLKWLTIDFDQFRLIDHCDLDLPVISQLEQLEFRSGDKAKFILPLLTKHSSPPLAVIRLGNEIDFAKVPE